MQKTILLIALCVFAVSASEHDVTSTLWNAWKAQHGRYYTATEDAARLKIFSDNLDMINKYNAEDNGVKLALNQFADLTNEEYRTQYASGSFYETDTEKVQKNTREIIVGGLPESVDWRSQGAVTAVKNQGSCGSCWSFSTTGVLETFYYTQNERLLTFSEQLYVDCDQSSYGCGGGFPYNTIAFAARYGAELENDYPYTGQQTGCRYNQAKAIKVNSNYNFVPRGSTDQLKAALVNGAVSVLVDAGAQPFQFYSSGVIFTGCTANLNHAVLAVGYQKFGYYEAFIVKNSWGTTWGDSGYLYIWSDQRQNQGQGVCGILAQPVGAL